MTFPITRRSLIQRLASGGDSADWRQFHLDYWGAVCSFARYAGRLNAADAEDVAAQAFNVILEAKLLQRWSETPTAKLRTLICSVVRKILANQRRQNQGRQAGLRENIGELDRYREEEPVRAAENDGDVFYRVWADDFIHRSIDALLDEYNSTGRGDYFRVLYGRICEEMSIKELASSLELSPSAVDNYFRHARRRLSELFEAALRDHVSRYCSTADSEGEFAAEWGHLGEFLQSNGGIESTIQRVERQPRTSRSAPGPGERSA
jgi:RNA polymerase sigma factor (sigma-70 family)